MVISHPIRDKAIEIGIIKPYEDQPFEFEYWIVPFHFPQIEIGLNGYICCSQFINFLPDGYEFWNKFNGGPFGGFTYHDKRNGNYILGFDICHYNPGGYPINSKEWTKGECIKMAEIVASYLISELKCHKNE